MMVRVYNKSGIGLIDTLMGTAIFAIIGLGTVTLLRVSSTTVKNSEDKAQLHLLKNKILGALQSRCGLYNTVRARVVKDSSTKFKCLLSCLPNDPECDDAHERECERMNDLEALSIYNDRGQKLTDAHDAALGFTKGGDLCDSQSPQGGFDPDEGNDACPFRYNFSARIDCVGETCKKEQMEVPIVIEGELVHAPKGHLGNVQTMSTADFAIKLSSNFTRTYRSCLDVKDTLFGRTPQVIAKSGVYLIDPDPTDAECPFEVYCDMQNANGGWTLAANMENEGQTSPPPAYGFDSNEVGPPLLPGRNGQLSDKLMELLLKGRKISGVDANLRLVVVNPPGAASVVRFQFPEGLSTGPQRFRAANSSATNCSTGFGDGYTLAGFATGKYGFSGVIGTSPNILTIGYGEINYLGVPAWAGFYYNKMGTAEVCGLTMTEVKSHLRGQLWVR